MEFRDVERLSQLLKEEGVDSGSDDEQQDAEAVRKLYQAKPKSEKKEGYDKPFKAVVKGNAEGDKKGIWAEDEVPESEIVDDEKDEDDREQPEYDIVYKQSVSPEDVYMNMGLKDPSSMSCNEMVVKVQLPKEPLDKVDISLTPTVLLVRSPRYKLYLELPRTVDDKKGKAEFDRSKSMLRLILPIKQRSLAQVIQEDY